MENATCPVCNSGLLVSQTDAGYTCNQCGVTLKLEGRNCPACGESNPAQREECQNCEEPLTSFSQVFIRHQPQSPPLRQRQMRQQAEGIQQAGKKASEERMDGFLEIDRRREARTRLEEMIQREKDRKVLKIAAIGSAALFLVLLILGIALMI